MSLAPGAHAFVYLGLPASINEALAFLEGKYREVEWVPVGGVTVRYRPGVGTSPPVITYNAKVTIYVPEAVTVSLPPAWVPR